MISLLLLAALQDDFSTPEKTLAAYLAARDQFASEASIAPKLIETIAKVEAPLTTQALQDRRTARVKQATEWEGAHRERSVSHTVLERKEERGVVTLVVAEKVRRKRLAFTKIGDRWLIEQEWDACAACRGTGICPWCEGKGELNARRCPRCDATKACDACAGQQWKARDFQHGITRLMDRPTVERRIDTSSPRATAEAFADALVDEQAQIGRLLRDVFQRSQAVIQTFYVEAVWKASEAALAKAAEEGARALSAHTPAVEKVEQIEESASAVVLGPPSLFGPAGKRRVLMKKIGGRWLVDNLQSQCISCEGTGVCIACKGKAKEVRCVHCSNVGTCVTCKGVGFTPDE